MNFLKDRQVVVVQGAGVTYAPVLSLYDWL